MKNSPLYPPDRGECKKVSAWKMQFVVRLLDRLENVCCWRGNFSCKERCAKPFLWTRPISTLSCDGKLHLIKKEEMGKSLFLVQFSSAFIKVSFEIKT